LRGGLAIALALSIGPEIPAAPILLAMTYVVVLFSIVVQGLTFRRLLPPPT
jgi:CPA1 family monovalent cation:H+ antiporter